MKRLDFKGHKFAKSEDNSKLLPFQDYALRIIKEFGIAEKKYQSIIFRYAKRNRSFLEGKVALCREKFGDKLEDKARYLIKLFSRKKPWE